MTIDVSRGQAIDYHAFSVIDITHSPYKVVATFRNNVIPPAVYPNIINKIATSYNEAWVLVETNDIGGQVMDIIKTELEYERIIYTSDKVGKGQCITEGFGRSRAKPGVRTSAKVKSIGCSLLKNLIEEDKLIVEDFETISELTTFVAKKNSYAADDGHHDDLVMTLVLFAWMSQESYFKEMCGTNVTQQLYDAKTREIEENLAPFGFIVGGMNDEDEGPVIEGGDVWFDSEDSIKDFF